MEILFHFSVPFFYKKYARAFRPDISTCFTVFHSMIQKNTTESDNIISAFSVFSPGCGPARPLDRIVSRVIIHIGHDRHQRIDH